MLIDVALGKTHTLPDGRVIEPVEHEGVLDCKKLCCLRSKGCANFACWKSRTDKREVYFRVVEPEPVGEQIYVKLNETHRLPDGRLVRCVECDGTTCDGCEFDNGFDCEKPVEGNSRLACTASTRKDGEARHFVLVEEPEPVIAVADVVKWARKFLECSPALQTALLHWLDKLPSEPEPAVPHGIAQLEVQVHNLETSNEQLRSALSKRKAENKRVLSKVRTDAKERDASVTSLRGRVDAMSRRASTYRKERDMLREENERLKSEVDYRWPEGLGWDGVSNCVELLKEKKEEIERLQKRLEAAQHQCKFVKDKYTTLAKSTDLAVADAEFRVKDEILSQAGPLLRKNIDESVVKVRAEVAGWLRELQKESFEARPTIGRGWTADKLADKLLDKLEPAGMTFDEAMQAIADGKRVRRRKWRGYLLMHEGNVSWNDKTRFVTGVDDIKATDWVVVESEAK